LQIKTKIVSCHTADSKPVKPEVNGTAILPLLVFPVLVIKPLCQRRRKNFPSPGHQGAGIRADGNHRRLRRFRIGEGEQHDGGTGRIEGVVGFGAGRFRPRKEEETADIGFGRGRGF
jgi:hypothetical protein